MRSKKRKKSKRSQSSSNKIFILLALIILGLSFNFLTSSKAAYLARSNNFEDEVIPSNSPTPTAIPTPTPFPLVGYCLNVPVLMYHHVQPQAQAVSKSQTALSVDNGIFDQQMEYLTSHGYNFLSAQELVNALRNKSGLSSKSILLTLDDGYSDSYQYAYPVIQKYHIKANLMIPTGLLGGADYANWGQVEEMGRSGLVYYTDHTWSHYSLPNGTVEKVKYEIDIARDQLQSHTGQTINVFTYPYGSFDNLSIQILAQEGFIGAFSTIQGNWQCDSFIMALHRKRIGNSSMSYYGF